MDHNHPINTGEHAANDVPDVDWKKLNEGRETLKMKHPSNKRRQQK